MLLDMTTFLSLFLTWSLQTGASTVMVSREVYITQQTCGTTIGLSANEALFLDYHGSVLDYNTTEKGHHRKFLCTIDVKVEDLNEQMCIETEQSLLKEGCRLKFRWHDGSRDFMLFGLSTYWCDMFRYSSICLPVWRSRVLLETSPDASMRMQFTTKRKVQAKPILEQPRHVNINKPFVYGLRGRLSLDFYIVLTALVFIFACAAVVVAMRHMKNRANSRRILSTHIELAQINQTQTESCNLIQQNVSPHVEFHNSVQEQCYPNVHQHSNSERKNTSSYCALTGAVAMPPPYIEKPPPYHRSS